MELEEIVKKIAVACGWDLKVSGERMVVDVPTGKSRRQLVAITRETDITDQPIIRYTSVVGLSERVDLEVCLKENAKLSHGALAILEGKLVLTDTQLAKTADPAEVAAAIGNIAAYADRFERELFGPDVY
jgi:hypothetical protein